MEAYARTGTTTTRRRALRGAGAATTAALLAGCTSSDPAGPPKAETGTRARAAALRARTAATSRSLLERYDAVIARHPDEASRLAPLRDAVAEHVKALAPGSPSPAGSPTSSGKPAGAAGTAAARAAVPADPVAAVQSLATAERQAGREQTAALMDAAAPPELARLLASIAAANAVHLYLLSPGAGS